MLEIKWRIHINVNIENIVYYRCAIVDTLAANLQPYEILFWEHDKCRPPDNKVHGTNMGPIWVRQDPGGPHVDPMNCALWADKVYHQDKYSLQPALSLPMA